MKRLPTNAVRDGLPVLELDVYLQPRHLTSITSFGDILSGGLRWDPATEERLNQLAMDTGRNTECHLRVLVEQGMDDQEDAYLGASALDTHRRTDKATISLDQLMRNLDL